MQINLNYMAWAVGIATILHFLFSIPIPEVLPNGNTIPVWILFIHTNIKTPLWVLTLFTGYLLSYKSGIKEITLKGGLLGVLLGYVLGFVLGGLLGHVLGGLLGHVLGVLLGYVLGFVLGVLLGIVLGATLRGFFNITKEDFLE